MSGQSNGVEESDGLGEEIVSQSDHELYLLPDGRRVKSWSEVCVGSFAIQIALWIQCVVSVMEGKEISMIFSAVLTIRCRVLRSEMVQFLNQTVMQLLRMLSTVPL